MPHCGAWQATHAAGDEDIQPAGTSDAPARVLLFMAVRQAKGVSFRVPSDRRNTLNRYWARVKAGCALL